MEKFNELLKIAFRNNLWFWIFSLISIGLIVSSFIIPPVGIIDPSVMAGVGEIFAFAALGAVIKAVEGGTKATVRHGNTELHLGQDKEESREKEDKRRDFR